MGVLFRSKGFAGAAGLALAVLAAPALACEMKVLGEIPVHFSDGQPMVTARIDGRAGEFVLDTASRTSVVTPAGARALGVETYWLDESQKLGGSGPREMVDRQTLVVGRLHLSGITFRVASSPAIGSAAGTLGLDAFGDGNVELDLGHGKVRLLRPVGCVGEEVLYWGGAYSTLPLTVGRHGWSTAGRLNDKAVAVVIDSAAPVSAVAPATVDAVDAKVSPDPGMAHGFRGYRRARGGPRSATFTAFALDQETVRQVRLPVVDLDDLLEPRRAGDTVATPGGMALGADFLQSHRLLAAPDQGRIYVTYNGGPVFKAP